VCVCVCVCVCVFAAYWAAMESVSLQIPNDCANYSFLWDMTQNYTDKIFVKILNTSLRFILYVYNDIQISDIY